VRGKDHATNMLVASIKRQTKFKVRHN